MQRTSSRQLAPRLCRILDEDPDLARGVPGEHREAAITGCIAPVIAIRRGLWRNYEHLADEQGIGLLILDGLLIRRIGIDGRFGAELLGEGDLVRPWEPSEADWAAEPTVGWRALESTHVAVLDARVAYRLARYPGLTGQLVGRALRRSRNLAVHMAIVHQPRIELRLQMLFWHLAERWGRVAPDGVRVPFRLTHAVLADLVAARRPTVSTALAKLAEQNLVLSTDQAWVLPGQPPRELLAAAGIEGSPASSRIAAEEPLRAGNGRAPA